MFTERNASRLIYFLVLTGLLLFLPFLNKAFHVDDWVFLTGADRILNHFDDPYGEMLHFFGEYISYYQTTHPPAFFMFIAGLIALVGEANEFWLHVGNLIFPFLAVFFFYRITKKLGGNPFIPTLLFLTSFGFVVNAHNIMSDVPVLALGLGSLDFMIQGHQRGGRGWFAASGLLALLTWLIGYQGLPFLGVLVLFALIYQVPFRKWWPALAVPLLGLVAWMVITDIIYGTAHLFVAVKWPGGRVSFYELIHLFNKFRANLSYLGGFTFLVLSFLILTSWKSLRTSWLFLLLLLSLAISLRPSGYFPINTLSLLLFLTSGLLALAYISLEALSFLGWGKRAAKLLRDLDLGFALERPAKGFVALWVVAIFVGISVFGPYGIVRYAILFLPPVLILFGTEMERRLSSKLSYVLAGTLVLLQITLTLGLSMSDTILAGSYREYGKSMADRFHGRPERVWFSGELGTRWYFEKAGFHYLEPSGRGLKKGDFVIRPINDFGPSCQPHVCATLQKVATDEIHSSIPLQAHSRIAQAGFYSHYFGLLPFSVTNQPVEVFQIYRVIRTPSRSGLIF